MAAERSAASGTSPARDIVVVGASPGGVEAARMLAAQAGRIHVASPDLRHLTVGQGRVHLVFGPRENGARPAADPLFRRAAKAYGGAS